MKTKNKPVASKPNIKNLRKIEKTICRAHFASVRIVTSLSGLVYEQIILHAKLHRFIKHILKKEDAVSYPSSPYMHDLYTCLRPAGKQGEGNLCMQAL